MKFSLEATKAAAKQTGSMDLIEATEGLMNAWQDLTVAQRGMDEVCDVMDNIQTSIEHLQKFGDKSVAVLNADKSLESLLRLPEKLITAEKAQEGLGDAAKKAWDTLVEWCKKIWDAIASFCEKIVEFLTNKSESNLKKIKEIKERVKKGKKKPGNVTEGGVGGMRDPGEEGLNASLEAKVQLADGGEMTYWKIGKYSNVLATIGLLEGYGDIVRSCSTGILNIKNLMKDVSDDDPTNFKSSVKSYFDEVIRFVKYWCGDGTTSTNDYGLNKKISIPLKNGIGGCDFVFPVQFSSPGNVTEDKLSQNGWKDSSLVSMLKDLEKAHENTRYIEEYGKQISKWASSVGNELKRYTSKNGENISTTRVCLQTANTAAQNILMIASTAIKGHISVAKGLTKVAEDAAKALGY